MIYEYAINPELIYECIRDENRLADLEKDFGLGSPRVVSSFPYEKANKWRSNIFKNAPQDTGVLESYFVDVVNHLHRAMVLRSASASNDLWVDKALIEHDRRPFEGVFTSNKPEGSPDNFFSDKDAYKRKTFWNKPRSGTIYKGGEKNFKNLALNFKNVMRLSATIKIVDYCAWKDEPTKSIGNILKLALEDRVFGIDPELCVFTGKVIGDSKNDDKFPTAKRIHDSYKEKFDLNVVVKIMENVNPAKDFIHNRYILTDLCAIRLGDSIDFYRAEDEWNIFEASIQERLWKRYSNNSSEIRIVSSYPPEDDLN